MEIKSLLITAMHFSLSTFANSVYSHEATQMSKPEVVSWCENKIKPSLEVRMSKSEVMSWYENEIKPFLDKSKAERLIGNLNLRKSIYELALMSNTFEGFYHIMMFVKHEMSLEKPVESDLLSKIVRLEWDVNHDYPLLKKYKQASSHIDDLIEFDHFERDFLKDNRKEIISYLANNIWMIDEIISRLFLVFPNTIG